MLPYARTAARIAAGLVALAVACDVSRTNAPGDGDAGLGDGGVDKAICPSAEPPPGSGCALPPGTTCQFGACGTRVARCDRGAWIYAKNPPPSPPCPTTPPAEDEPCPACWPGGACAYAPETCTPFDAGDGGATPSTAVAQCLDGRWRLEFRACQPSADSGADVQRDADVDAD